MIVLKVLVIVLFALSWWRSKSTKTVEPSDFFYISFLLIYVPGFLGNPSGNSEYNQLKLSPLSAHNAEIGLLSTMVVGIVILNLRRAAEMRLALSSKVQSCDLDRRTLDAVSIGAASVSALITIMLAFHPDFIEYKYYVWQFLTLNLSGVAYRFMRIFGFYDSFIVNVFFERIRFTILPVLYAFSVAALIARRKMFLSIFCAAAFFFVLPASLSKLPLIIYAGYFLVLSLEKYPRLLSVGWLVIISLIVSVLLVEGLSLLYIAQYTGSIAAGKTSPVDLAFQRIWGEPYSIIVRYYEAYPKIISFTGWDGINLVARLIGHDTRMPDIEVADRILGPDSGSNPGVFFVAGYAAFGQIGLVAFAAAGFAGLWFIDLLGRKLHFSFLRSIYVALMGVNVLFLNQIALQTALLTYGLGLIPFALLATDRALLYVRPRPVQTPSG